MQSQICVHGRRSFHLACLTLTEQSCYTNFRKTLNVCLLLGDARGEGRFP